MTCKKKKKEELHEPTDTLRDKRKHCVDTFVLLRVISMSWIILPSLRVICFTYYNQPDMKWQRESKNSSGLFIRYTLLVPV